MTEMRGTVVRGTDGADTIVLAKIGEGETIKNNEIFLHDVPQYDENTGKYSSNVTHEQYKLETYANGMPGEDTMYGTDGNDWINGSYGNDVIYGGKGNVGTHDMLSGGEDGTPEGSTTDYGNGNDVVIAGEKADEDEDGATTYEIGDKKYTAKLSDGSAEIYGYGGDDILIGGNGNDYIWGGTGTNHHIWWCR